MRTKGIFKRINVCISLCLVMLLQVGIVTAQNTSPLCFTARNGSVTVRFDINWNVTHTIQYSINGTSWSTYTSNTNVTISANQSIYFRAASNQTVATAFGTSNNWSRFYFTSSNGGTVEGSGNIMSLYGPNCPNLPLQPYAFTKLFYACTLLTTPPELPATTLSNRCYSEMFNGCASLSVAPLLPANVMYDGCYLRMFKDCTSLLLPPELPATSVQHSYCYQEMFSGCTHLKKAPNLPATLVGAYCYYKMFNNCTSIKTVPTLPADNFNYSATDYCYSMMFNGCTSLVVNTVGPGKKIRISPCTSNYDNNCFQQMFSGTSGTMNNTPRVHTNYYVFSAVNLVSVNINDLNMGYVSGTGYYENEMNATLSANAYPHYHFVNWGNGDTSLTVSLCVIKDTIFTANFATDQHTVTVSGEHGQVVGGGTYDYGSTVTLTASNEPHYHFVRWTDNNLSNPRTITVEGDTTYTAVFEIDKFIVNAAALEGRVTGIGTYDYGSTVTLTAISNSHYHFVRWGDGDTINPKTITVNNDMYFDVVFEIDKHTISADCTNGSVIGTGAYDYGSYATLTPIPDEHYHFVRWSDGVSSTIRVVAVRGDSTFTALCEIDKHIVSGSGRNGIITGLGEYDYGSTVTLTAIPDEHYCDVTWSDGDSVLSKSFVITEDVNYTADFAKCQYVVNATCEHGEVTGNGIYENPDIVTLYVETYDGYRFVEWSDGEVYNPRVFVVEGDLEVEAICEAVTGVEDVEESVAFYYVRGRVVNPEGVMLRMYSTEGKMVKIGDGDIMMEGLPAGMYMVVDERGRSLKVVVKP